MISYKFRTRIHFPRCVSRYATRTEPKKLKEGYKSTVFLPKTKFPAFTGNAPERDRLIWKEAKFGEYYEWQREHVRGDEFVLHDGPPYANGTPHMGHAINKIFKDIILRAKLVQGLKVHFVPGWDCHGLPIELIALKGVTKTQTVKQIREKSQILAFKQINIQRHAFENWGIIGNWNKYYYTCSPEYVKNELQMFWTLYEKGYIFHGLKPVYWSPSSKTALAEAELEYNVDHVSPSVTVRFEVEGNSDNEPMYLMVWTTTPWTLPSNAAVFFTTQLEYSLVKIDSLPGSYIIASKLVEENKKKMNREITVVRTVTHEELKSLKYKHPWWKDRLMNVFDSSEVKEVATGLLHSAPAHGHVDFSLGLKHNLSMECYVDETGSFTTDAGDDLRGLNVLDEGSTRVMEKLESDILVNQPFVHSYPYDWRTKKPVIIRASKQWFIDTEKLKAKAIESLEGVSIPMNYFKTNLQARPFWCLSRQRVWGVPIPVFIKKTTGEFIISKELIDHIGELIVTSGTNSWWLLGMKDLFPKRFCDEFKVSLDDIEKGKDIMDIWFDSGVSWSFALDGKIADVCVEGVDQFRGWFQSLLLTSVAVRNRAPYKRLLVHGMAVDDEGKKMSKSIGNVFDPKQVVEGDKAFGVDTLRWWVASHGHQANAPVSMQRLEQDLLEIKKIRQTFRFILGTLNGVTIEDVKKFSPSCHLDHYWLNESFETYHSVMNSYNAYNFQGVTANLLRYISNVSSLYITLVKDRLYCDELSSIRRTSCVYTFAAMLETLCQCVAPILPHLAEEVYRYSPIHAGKLFFYNDKMWKPPSKWRNNSYTEVIDLAKDIRQEVLAFSPKPEELSCLVEIGEREYCLLKDLQDGMERSSDSELTEILQVADVTLKIGERKVTLEKTTNQQCGRCRRFTASGGLCPRCENIVSKSVTGRAKNKE